MNLSRKQIKLLMNGSLEVSEIQKEASEKVKNNGKPVMNNKNQTKKKNDDDSNNFYSLFDIPGIKMTDKAKKKFIDSKKIKGNE